MWRDILQSFFSHNSYLFWLLPCLLLSAFYLSAISILRMLWRYELRRLQRKSQDCWSAIVKPELTITRRTERQLANPISELMRVSNDL